ncbi:hypothetical protein [Allochromatium vinosum]|uniref:Uncharacterized protein n=1 Tax=Allochromatium vinosum (strain ATCC 17899 / DSM 180 / NBRC 103801 / NCIMB 10441 / D) TaxID=572477 RepID=D3RNF2_ALLVD|nr:hypothetical protein [Allochromatium vinosum]ADC63317.1 hypothetical protein Alvin_2401 [Allochromatium vinosum DSM 180]
MMETLTAEQRQAVQDLMMSPTIGLLGMMAKSMPLDCTKMEDIKTGLSTSALEVVRALDAGRIHFDRPEDAAMLHGLLAVCFEVVLDGRFAANAQVVRAS